MRGPLDPRILRDPAGSNVSVGPVILLDCCDLLLCYWIPGAAWSTDPTGSRWIVVDTAGLFASTGPGLHPLGRRILWDPTGSTVSVGPVILLDCCGLSLCGGVPGESFGPRIPLDPDGSYATGSQAPFGPQIPLDPDGSSWMPRGFLDPRCLWDPTGSTTSAGPPVLLDGRALLLRCLL